jgi:hypothetical protein
MDKETFYLLLSDISVLIRKRNANVREAILPVTVSHMIGAPQASVIFKELQQSFPLASVDIYTSTPESN